MSWPSKTIAPGGRLVEPEHRPADGRLAAAGLADEAERLAALDRERHAVHGLDVTDVAVEDDPALDREPDLEVVELDERAGARSRRPSCGSRRPPRSAATRRRAPG